MGKIVVELKCECTVIPGRGGMNNHIIMYSGDYCILCSLLLVTDLSNVSFTYKSNYYQFSLPDVIYTDHKVY